MLYALPDNQIDPFPFYIKSISVEILFHISQNLPALPDGIFQSGNFLSAYYFFITRTFFHFPVRYHPNEIT